VTDPAFDVETKRPSESLLAESISTNASGYTEGTTGAIVGSATLPNEITKVYDYLEFKYKVPSGSNSWITFQDGTTGEHEIYTVFNAPEAPEEIPALNVLNYACTWADGCTLKSVAATTVVSEFDNHYNWNYNCDELTFSFVRLVASLGVESTMNFWAGKGQSIWYPETYSVGDMIEMQTETVDPVGSLGSGKYWFGCHVWAEVDGDQYDPSFATHNDMSWGQYEDTLFADYRYYLAAGPPIEYGTQGVNFSGQDTGCEDLSNGKCHATQLSGSLADGFLDPPR
jgi:hypothetical protein